MYLENDFLTPDWKKKDEKVICGFSLPVYGNMALTRKSIISGFTTKENRINLSKKLNFDDKFMFSPHQIHSDIVIYVDDKNIGFGSVTLDNAIDGDACITDKKNFLILITWADCIPVLLYDPISKIVGAVHSGWRGTNLNIVRKTVKKMIEKNAHLENIYVSIGPGIRDCCYEVGLNFKIFFDNDKYGDFLIKKKDKLFFDLAGCVYRQLVFSGIKEENIDFYGKCNSCSKTPDFFSCRKDGKEKFEAQSAFIGMFD